LISGCGSKKRCTAAAKTEAPKSDAAKRPKRPSCHTGGRPRGQTRIAGQGGSVQILKSQDDVSAWFLLAEESVIIRPEIDGRVIGLHFQEGQASRRAKL